jgi:hypothetical protein
MTDIVKERVNLWLKKKKKQYKKCNCDQIATKLEIIHEETPSSYKNQEKRKQFVDLV